MPLLSMPASLPTDSPHILRSRLRDHGFLFLPLLLPTARVNQLRQEVGTMLAAEGWLADPASTDLVPRRAARHGAHGWWRLYQRIQALERFHALAHTPTLTDVIQAVLGRQVLNHPRRQLTMISPRFWIPPHQDHLHIQGTADTVTAWVPLVSTRPGEGMQVLAERGPRRLRPVGPDRYNGVGISLDAGEDSWYAASDQFQPGDVVLVHSLAVRRTAVHEHQDLLLSAEFRYQPAWEPVTKGSLLPQHYPRLPSWKALTQGWSTRRWIRTPMIKHVVDYIMPTRIEEWHTLLPSSASTLVDVTRDC